MSLDIQFDLGCMTQIICGPKVMKAFKFKVFHQYFTYCFQIILRICPSNLQYTDLVEHIKFRLKRYRRLSSDSTYVFMFLHKKEIGIMLNCRTLTMMGPLSGPLRAFRMHLASYSIGVQRSPLTT